MLFIGKFDRFIGLFIVQFYSTKIKLEINFSIFHHKAIKMSRPIAQCCGQVTLTHLEKQLLYRILYILVYYEHDHKLVRLHQLVGVERWVICYINKDKQLINGCQQ